MRLRRSWRAAFDPIAVGQAFITRIASRAPLMEIRELKVYVKLDEDSFGLFTDEGLRALLLVAGQRIEEASKAVALYALGELGAADIVMQALRPCRFGRRGRTGRLYNTNQVSDGE